MAGTKISIYFFPDGGANVEIKGPVKIQNVSCVNDPGYETDVKTYEDEEEGILYDNLD